jgi:hypothetical protein
MSEGHSTDIKMPGGAALTVPTKSVGPRKCSAAGQKKTLRLEGFHWGNTYCLKRSGKVISL